MKVTGSLAPETFVIMNCFVTGSVMRRTAMTCVLDQNALRPLAPQGLCHRPRFARFRGCHGKPGIGNPCTRPQPGALFRGLSGYRDHTWPCGVAARRLSRHFGRCLIIQSVRAHSKPMSRPAFSDSIHLCFRISSLSCRNSRYSEELFSNWFAERGALGSSDLGALCSCSAVPGWAPLNSRPELANKSSRCSTVAWLLGIG